FFDRDPVQFLLELSSIVRALYVGQPFISGVARCSNYLFGLHNIDWAPIFIELMSRKVDTLKIDDYWYTPYLSMQGADALRERLPMLGKKIWFEATCNVYKTAMMYEINDHSVNADPSRNPR
ncbi:hypothetical protein PENTCL1PPCAC_4039, partial [Pristionchus entomophagus]